MRCNHDFRPSQERIADGKSGDARCVQESLAGGRELDHGLTPNLGGPASDTDSATDRGLRQRKVKPRKLETLPRKLETLPRKLETLPRKLETLPRKLETLRRKLETLLRKLETLPRKLETLPRKLETLPRKLETLPGKFETLQCKVEISRYQRTRWYSVTQPRARGPPLCRNVAACSRPRLHLIALR